MKQLTALIFLIVILTGCKSNESVLLRLKFKKDDEQPFAVSYKDKCGNVGYLDVRINASYTADSDLTKDQYYLTAKVSSVKADMNFDALLMQNVELHYDSEQRLNDMGPAEREMNTKMDTVLSSYYDITVNSKGQITKPFTRIGKPIKQPFGAALVQLPFPDRKVKVGDSWTAEMENPLANAATRTIGGNMTFTYTVNDITKTNVIIDAQLDVNFKRALMNSSGDNHMHGTGQYIIDRTNGRTISGYFTVPMQGCDDALISIIRGNTQ